MEGADIGVIWPNEVEETNLRWATTTLRHPLIPTNETWTVLKGLDRVYGQGYGRIVSDRVG